MKISIIFLPILLSVAILINDLGFPQESCIAQNLECEAEYNVTYTHSIELLGGWFPVSKEDISCETGGDFVCPEVPCRVDVEVE